MDEPQELLHWYDFMCPFSYVAQDRTAILARRGMEVAELPFRAHPEIPPGGIRAQPRVGPHRELFAAHFALGEDLEDSAH